MYIFQIAFLEGLFGWSRPRKRLQRQVARVVAFLVLCHDEDDAWARPTFVDAYEGGDWNDVLSRGPETRG